MARKDYKEWAKKQRIKEWGEDNYRDTPLSKLITYTVFILLGVAAGSLIMGLLLSFL